MTSELSPVAKMVWRAIAGGNGRPGERIDAKSTYHRATKEGLRNGEELHTGMRELHEARLVDYPEGADDATLTEQGFNELHS